MAVKPGIGRCLETQAASTTVDGCDDVREFDTFDDARQLVRALELAPRLHPHEGRIGQYCSRLRQRTFGAHRAMPDGGENGLDRIGGAKNARGDRRDIFDGVIFLEGLDCRHGCHVAGNCKNASVHALCCSLFENHFGKNYRICCNNDNAADRWDTEYGRVEFTEALGLSPTVRRDIIGKGKGHFGSLDSRHVMHSEYQIRCSKRDEIIKLDTRYQIKRTAKSLEFMKPDSCI